METIDNRNIDLEQVFKEETGINAVTYDDEYDYEFYVEEYTKWLENKIEELTMVIFRSVPI